MKRRCVLLWVIVFVLSACAPSEQSLATAAAMTQQVEEYEALARTATKLALGTDTPTSTPFPTTTATETVTPTGTPTLKPTPTPTPPPGSSYVPDCVGLTFSEAKAILERSGISWYYVAVIKKDVAPWMVLMQEPLPGYLLDLDEGNVKLVVSVHSFTPTPKPVKKGGRNTSRPCQGLSYHGFCVGKVLLYCWYGTVLLNDCAACGGYCGWKDSQVGNVCFCP